MGKSRARTIKYCAYGLMLVAIFVLQGSNALGLTLFGAQPDILPFAVAAIALLEGPFVGAFCGFGAGLMLTLSTPLIEGLSALWLSLFGLAFGWLGSLYMRQILPSAILGGVCCIAVRWICLQLFYYGLFYGLPIYIGAKLLAGQLILSAPIGCLVFFLVRRVNRRFGEYDI